MVSLSAITSALSSESSIVSTAILLENPLPKDPPARVGTVDARPKRRHGDRSRLRSCQCTFGLEQGAHDACVLMTFPPRPPPLTSTDRAEVIEKKLGKNGDYSYYVHFDECESLAPCSGLQLPGPVPSRIGV